MLTHSVTTVSISICQSQCWNEITQVWETNLCLEDKFIKKVDQFSFPEARAYKTEYSYLGLLENEML